MLSGGRLARAGVALLLAVATVAVASPAQARPAQVGAPWVKAASATWSSATLTLDWNPARGASRYEVFWSTTYDGALKSTAWKRTTRATEYKITGLKPGRMYCFTVRAIGSGTGDRSPRHCKWTMRRPNSTNLETARVATFNICSNAGGCAGSWNSRVRSIQEHVKLADADVVALQESSCVGCSNRRAKVEQVLAGLPGWAIAHYSTAKTVIYRTARFERAAGGEGQAYGYIDAGHQQIDDDRGATWADLVSRSTGKRFRFVSVHLQNGTSTQASNLRKYEIDEVIAQLKNLERTSPMSRQRTIVMGDFNSHRNRTADWPRAQLNRAGWHDTYDRSATYTKPRNNSANQFSRNPITSTRYGDHVDKIFVPEFVGSTTWRTVNRFNPSGWYTSPLPSDHSPVRVTLYLW